MVTLLELIEYVPLIPSTEDINPWFWVDWPMITSPLLNWSADLTLRNSFLESYSWTTPLLSSWLVINSPFANESFSRNTSKVGKYDSGVIVPNDSKLSKSPGCSPGFNSPVKLYLSVGKSPPILASASVIVNNL